jgi:hypothetical protein
VAREGLARLAGRGVEKLNVFAGGGRQRFAVWTNGDQRCAGGHGRLESLHILRPRPELELLEAAGGQPRPVGAER